MKMYAVTGYEYGTGSILRQEFYTSKTIASKRVEHLNKKPREKRYYIDYYELEEHNLFYK